MHHTPRPVVGCRQAGARVAWLPDRAARRARSRDRRACTGAAFVAIMWSMTRARATRGRPASAREEDPRGHDPAGDRTIVDLGPSAPSYVATGDVMRLQRAAGNRATQALIQRLVEDEGGRPAGGREAGTGTIDLPPPERIGEGMGWAEGMSAPSAAPGPGDGGAAPTRRMVRRGSRGADVVDLQERLNALAMADPALETDGIFGGLTDAAVRRFQAERSLVVDGIVGPNTWAALDSGGGGGGGEGPGPQPPVTDPLAGIVTIVGHGASEGAVARARVQAIELYGGIAPANRARMEADPVWVDVIPHDRKLTELPEYAHLAGTQTFDGRIWDDVRGIQTVVAGKRRVAVAEEDLVTVSGTAASYGSGFLAAHEGGHALQFSGLTTTQQATLQAIYAARLAASGPITQTTPAGAATAMWLRPAWYSAANKEEYFANSVAAWHGHPYTNGEADVEMYTHAWLQTNDPPMFQLLTEVYQQGGAAA